MIIICDGQNLIYRHVFFDSNRSSGHIVRNLLELVDTYRADALIVCWDGGSDKRKKIYSGYKENRKKDLELARKVNSLREDTMNMFKICGITQCLVVGDEGDDILASFVKNIFKDEEVLICSNDADFYSLLSDKVKIWNWKELRTDDWFRHTYGIEPEDWIKIRSLSGDGSDNISGVKGIGIKKALKIIDDDKYNEFKERSEVKLSKELLEFINVPEDVLIENLDFGDIDKFRIMQMLEFCQLEFGLMDNIMELYKSERMRRWRLSKLESEMLECKKCEMRKDVNNVVCFKGNLNSNILIVGEAPGEEEDAAGIPFIGRAGRLLDEWVDKMGIKDKVLVGNVVWCRSINKEGKNRTPKPKEIEFCSELGIKKLVKYLLPQIVICLGETAGTYITGSKKRPTKDYGRYKIDRFGISFMVWCIPHPASTFYSGGTQAIIFDQLDEIKKYLEEIGI